MRAVRREEILDYVTYEEQRDGIRDAAMAAKQRRRIHVEPCLTFLFENTETIRYQILEMVRTERIVREADIRHELDTYNDLLGAGGELGCTLLVEIVDEAERREKLGRWRDLPEHVYLRLDDGTRVRPVLDERQRSEEKLSAVQFLKFDTKGHVPCAIGVDGAELSAETTLTDDQRGALAADLAG